MADHIIEVMQNDPHATIAPARKKSGNQIGSRPTVEFQTLEIPVENADMLACGGENGIHGPMVGSARIERLLYAYLHDGGL
jgi:hypothetical protein